MEHRYFDALSRLCRLFYNLAANFLPPHTHSGTNDSLDIFKNHPPAKNRRAGDGANMPQEARHDLS